MPTFSTLIQTPEVRAIVQEGYLERAFHDALFPLMLYRGDVASVPWPGQVGDTQIFTGKGTIEPNGRPIAPGVDPTPKSYPLEQWSAQLHQYADTMDTHMPTSVQATARLIERGEPEVVRCRVVKSASGQRTIGRACLVPDAIRKLGVEQIAARRAARIGIPGPLVLGRVLVVLLGIPARNQLRGLSPVAHDGTPVVSTDFHCGL
jgi:hypothetical protein